MNKSRAYTLEKIQIMFPFFEELSSNISIRSFASFSGVSENTLRKCIKENPEHVPFLSNLKPKYLKLCNICRGEYWASAKNSLYCHQCSPIMHGVRTKKYKGRNLSAKESVLRRKQCRWKPCSRKYYYYSKKNDIFMWSCNNLGNWVFYEDKIKRVYSNEYSEKKFEYIRV